MSDLFFRLLGNHLNTYVTGPGGWLQWDETDVPHTKIVWADSKLSIADQPEPGATVEKQPSFIKLRGILGPPGAHTWMGRFEEIMSQHGLVDGRKDIGWTAREFMKAESDANFMGITEFANKLRDLGRGEQARVLSETIEGAAREMGNHGAWAAAKFAWTGRKPEV